MYASLKSELTKLTPCTRCSDKVKQEKDGVGEQLAGKGEL